MKHWITLLGIAGAGTMIALERPERPAGARTKRPTRVAKIAHPIAVSESVIDDAIEQCYAGGLTEIQDLARCVAACLYPSFQWPPAPGADEWYLREWSRILDLAVRGPKGSQS